MARVLRVLGTLLVAAAVWLFLAGATGWMEDSSSSSLGRDALLGGLLCIGAGFLVGMFGRAGQVLRRGHCVRCGAPTERGQTYCLDHLLATVDEYRMKESPSRRPRP